MLVSLLDMQLHTKINRFSLYQHLILHYILGLHVSKYINCFTVRLTAFRPWILNCVSHAIIYFSSHHTTKLSEYHAASTFANILVVIFVTKNYGGE